MNLPKITWQREENGSWVAYYGVKALQIKLIRYTKGIGKWWLVSRRSEDQSTCDPYFMKHCNDQCGMDEVKVEVAEVLEGKIRELTASLPWLVLLDQLKGVES